MRGGGGRGRPRDRDGVARAGRDRYTPDDYASVYGRVLSGVSQPAILHWLGPMFDPALAGYWGADDLDAATDTCVAIIEAHAAKIDGIKLSLLDAERESSCAAGSPRACACTPATTSTTRR